MTRNTVGWFVRTDTAGRHRYWRVGAPDPGQAAALACDTAGADTAQAVNRIQSHHLDAYPLSPGQAVEVVWESRPVTQGPEVLASDARRIGEITFDIVVPDEGVTHVDGCYRVNGGNWQVYYLTNRNDGVSSIVAPAIGNAVFSSGITGVSGIVPADWVLTKTSTQAILAEVVGVDGWIEVTGPNSLIIK